MPFFGGGGGGGDYHILTNNNIDGGDNAMALVTGVNNIALGNSALQNITTGSYNIALGNRALINTLQVQSNIAIGNNAMSSWVGSIEDYDGSDMVCIGENSAADMDDGMDCVYIGTNSGAISTRAIQAIAIGTGAKANSKSIAIGVGNQAGLNSIAIGGTNGLAAGDDEILIGDDTISVVRIGAYDLASLPVTVPLTWAELPTANSVSPGAKRFITDVGVGGSFWYSDGARWRLVGGNCTLYNNYTPITSAANTIEQLLDQIQLPPGLLQVGDEVRIWSKLTKSGVANSCTRRYKLGTLGTLSDTIIYTNVGVEFSTSRVLSELQSFKCVSATSVSRSSAGSIIFIGVGVIPLGNIVIPNISNSLYLSIASQMTVGAETVTIDTFTVELVTGGN